MSQCEYFGVISLPLRSLFQTNVLSCFFFAKHFQQVHFVNFLSDFFSTWHFFWVIYQINVSIIIIYIKVGCSHVHFLDRSTGCPSCHRGPCPEARRRALDHSPLFLFFLAIISTNTSHSSFSFLLVCFYAHPEHTNWALLAITNTLGAFYLSFFLTASHTKLPLAHIDSSGYLQTTLIAFITFTFILTLLTVLTVFTLPLLKRCSILGNSSPLY